MSKGFPVHRQTYSLKKSTIHHTPTKYPFSRLWHKELVGCGCAFHTVGCPRVVSTVHVQFAHLYYYFVFAVVHDLCAGGCSRCVMQAMALCCVCVCMLMGMRVIVPRVIRLVTCWYSVNKSIFSSAGWSDGCCRVWPL